MFDVFTVESTGGALRRAYAVVAEVGRWSLRDEKVETGVAVRITGQLAVKRPSCSGSRFDLVLHVNRERWTWRDVPVTVAGTSFVATLDRLPDQSEVLPA